MNSVRHGASGLAGIDSNGNVTQYPIVSPYGIDGGFCDARPNDAF